MDGRSTARRRVALVTTLVLLGVAALPAATSAAPTVPSGTPAGAAVTAAGSAPGRLLHGPHVAVPHHEGGTYDLAAGWRFALVNATAVTDPTGAFAAAAEPGYDDAAWRKVDLPHDWSIELNPSPGPGTTSGTGFYPGGLGWYRKSFTLPRSMSGKRIAVEFDGVYMDSEVYLNGALLGTHHYGYTGFSLDLAGAHTDGRTPNVLAVQVRNPIPSSRWYSGSGIYRNVRLVVTEQVHIERHGMVVTTPDLATTVPAGYGTVRVATTLTGTGPASAPVRVTSTVRDAAGRRVGSAGATVPPGATVSAGAAAATAQVDVRVARPRLWDVSDPYLYSVTTEVVAAGRVVDSYVSRMGFRWLRFDPQAGGFLNGRPIKFQGVNLHHDLGALGAAVNRDAMLRQLKIMKRMGVNAVRTSHNPPAPELVQLCEQLGLMMIVEAFDVWQVAKTRNDYARFFDADSDADLTEMVRQSRNSPAVVMWSIGNEIPDTTRESGVPVARRLVDLVRSLDPTRLVTIGSDRYRRVPATGSPAERILQMVDAVGLNYNTAASVDALHAKYPGTYFYESESSSETSTRGQYDQPEQLNTGENHTPGRRAASSYDNNLASWTMSGEYALKKDRDRPWFLGQFLWSGIDYIGEPTPFDVFPVKTSFFGAVDTAGFAKDQYHLFASQWTREPMVHLVPMNWTDHWPGDPVQVWAYTNAEAVELFLDGRSLGERRFDRKVTADGRAYLETTEATGDDKTVTGGAYPGSYTGTDGTAGHLRLTWTVPFQPGRLVAVARRGGVEVARDQVTTAAAPASVRLSTDRRIVPADGRSLVFVTADVVDGRGVVVPGAEHLLRFTVRGGRLVGVDNGRQESAESFKAAHRTAFHGKALAIVTPTGVGPVTVTASAAGLRTGTAWAVALPPDPRTAAAGQGRAPAGWFTPGAPERPVPATPDGPSGLVADASFTGADSTPPAMMVDGDRTTAWSNAYRKAATGLLPAVSAARRADWVSVSWADPRPVAAVTASFTTDAQRSPPASVTVSYWAGDGWRPVTGSQLSWSADGTVRVGFQPVTSTRLRLDLTSSRPQAPDGFLGITELGPEGP